MFEPEETVGLYWHKLVSGTSSYKRHPDAAVRLESMKPQLGVMFRALGGGKALRIVEGMQSASGHRLGFYKKIGLGREKLDRPILDQETIRLPPLIDTFPDSRCNALLYEWLAAWFAHVADEPTDADDPLQADIISLRLAYSTTTAALKNWPGLRPIYSVLCENMLQLRPIRPLPEVENAIENVIRTLLAEGAGKPPEQPLAGLAGNILAQVAGASQAANTLRAPRRYLRFLPVPLWGDVVMLSGGPSIVEDESDSGPPAPEDNRRRKAARKPMDQVERKDSLLLHRFENIFSISEMLNLNRAVENDDEDSAKQAADDLDELTISQHDEKVSSRLKLDLDLAPADSHEAELQGEATYPEWDWRRHLYHPNHTRVLTNIASEEGKEWQPDEATSSQIKHVKRMFEALRPKRQMFFAQPDGDEFDLSALVRNIADTKARSICSDRIFMNARTAARDMSVAILMDVSLSTEAWMGTGSVIDVEKAALTAFTHGLTACGDEHAIYTFTSRRRSKVSVSTIKGFSEPLSPKVVRRIQALKPGQYTRIGAALRHVTTQLAERPHRYRLLMLITDGKPNDIDQYEGRYGIEDTRVAIQEARKAGLRVFGVTIDQHARDYFPYIFGRGAYAIISDPTRLPISLPLIYRQLTS